jgi:plasmid maintenance system antidote protein VapI
VGAMANLGHKLSDQTVGNIFSRHDVPSAPKRKHTTNWKDFIHTHLDVLAGTDFFTVEVVTLKGLIAYYVVAENIESFLHRQQESGRVVPRFVEGSCARNITADTYLRLCRFFELSEGYFLRLQNAYDTMEAKRKISSQIMKIMPYVKKEHRALPIR